MSCILIYLCILNVVVPPLLAVNSTTGWYVPTLSDIFEWVSKEAYERLSIQMDPHGPQPKVEFFLSTRRNHWQPYAIRVGDVGSLRSSLFNRQHPTRFTIHGWNGKCQNDTFNSALRSALLETGDYNVICVDWSQLAARNYIAARLGVADVGRMTAKFIEFLRDSGGMSMETLHVIGFSLGAHVAGFAGKALQVRRINTIIGLDPAGPLFVDMCAQRLCSSDAAHVTSIHTSGGLLGYFSPIGSLAFYPNGGRSQPGCPNDFRGSCAHERVYRYYAEAIKWNNFRTVRCRNFIQIVLGTGCGSTSSGVMMGHSSNFGVTGIYQVPVRSVSPYGD